MFHIGWQKSDMVILPIGQVGQHIFFGHGSETSSYHHWITFLYTASKRG
jgi:hypothetical protein